MKFSAGGKHQYVVKAIISWEIAFWYNLSIIIKNNS
jgi:hypothetical protein